MKVLGFGSGVETAPGVYTTERDFTQSAEAGASTTAGLAGVFTWGPVNQPTLVSTEDELALTFGKPATFNAETWFVGRNFLTYADKLLVNRVGNTSSELFSAVVNTASVNASVQALHTVENKEAFETASDSFTSAVDWIAKFPGAGGNSLRLSICTNADAFETTANLASATYGANITFTVGSANALIQMAANTTKAAVEAVVVPGDIIVAGNTSIGTQELKVLSVGNTAGTNVNVVLDRPFRLSANHSATTLNRRWEYASLVSGAPKTSWFGRSVNSTAIDEIHVVVSDEDGFFTGRPGTVLEVFEGLSRASDAVSPDGETTFFKTVLNRQSDFVWVGTAPTGVTIGTSSSVATLSGSTPINKSFALGADGSNETDLAIGTILRGFDAFAHKDQYDLSAVIVGKSRGGTLGEQAINYVIDNVGDIRQDVVVYGSLPKSAVVNNRGSELTAAKAFRNLVRSSSYGFLDSGYKYQYDKYNDVFRWVPLCGDIAGLSARTDVTNDPWFSPAGFNRGQIKDVIRLAWNPTPAEQKASFAADINNVIYIKGDGTYLMGDKTLLGFQSALNQLGTRKMLNILKSTLARAARGLLFEFNDEFTQARFKNLVDPLLRDVKGRRGIKDFRTVADSTNNTDFVVSSNRFVGDVFFVPARSIRSIQLNFTSVNNVAEFQEVA